MPSKRHALLLAAALSLLGAGAHAQSTPTPKELDAIQKQIEKSQEQQAQLKAKAEKLDKEIADLQAAAVKAAGEVQQTEAQVTELEDTLKALADEEQDKTAALETERQRLTQAVLALQRLSSQPPEALLFSSQAPVDAARTARLLALITPALDARARSLQSDLNELHEMRQRMAEQRDELAAAVAKLAGENARLAGLIGKKAQLQKSTLAESASAEAKLAKLGKQAKNLQDLIERLNKAKAETGPAEPPAAQNPPVGQDQGQGGQQLASAQPGPDGAAPATKQRMQQPAGFRDFPKAGASTLFAPARGRILTQFGAPMDTGGPSKGLVLETRPGAQIVAPFDGKIAFEGPFRSYGQILIIEHGGGYHTVLAGLDRLDAVVGQWLLAGEPVGVMAGPGSGQAAIQEAGSGVTPGEVPGETPGSGRPKLYVELRRDGQPIDPVPWFGAAIAKAVNNKGQ